MSIFRVGATLIVSFDHWPVELFTHNNNYYTFIILHIIGLDIIDMQFSELVLSYNCYKVWLDLYYYYNIITYLLI